MSNPNKNDLTLWLKGQGADPALVQTLEQIAGASVEISDAILEASLEGKATNSGTTNVQGEEQKALDIIANDIFLKHLENCPDVRLSVSEEVEHPIDNSGAREAAPFIVCFDPVDGSSNIETNSAIGTIFSILQTDDNASGDAENQILQSANSQIAAGYVLYGPTDLLVLTTGKSLAMFVLERKTGTFVLTKSGLSIVPQAAEFAINAAYSRFWDTPTATYVSECLAGKTGPRALDFNMRWSGAMVADVHRLFIRGGIFIYPALDKRGSENGKLRFLYEANPMAMLVEVAGGQAFMNKNSIRACRPKSIHQRVPVILGSASEVQRLVSFYSQ